MENKEIKHTVNLEPVPESTRQHLQPIIDRIELQYNYSKMKRIADKMKSVNTTVSCVAIIPELTPDTVIKNPNVTCAGGGCEDS